MARPQLDPQERWARTVGVRVTAAEAAGCFCASSDRSRQGWPVARWV